MRFAVVSDIHGNLPALRRVLTHIRSQGVDGTVNLGDCVSAPLWPGETFDLLNELSLPTVRGNHDRWLTDAAKISESAMVAYTAQCLAAEDRSTLATLPASMVIAGEIYAVHGTPQSDTEYLLEDSVDDRLCLATAEQLAIRLKDVSSPVILCGHSHQQNSVFASGRRLVVNPGSVGCPRYAGNPHPRRNEAGSPHARYAIITRTNGNWSATMFVLEYDWHQAADRAVSVGHPHWAEAFLKDA